MSAMRAARRLNDQWCERHWAPYRVPGVNAVYGAVAIMQAFLDSTAYAELADRSPEAINRLMEESEEPLCCRLGDGVMDRIFDAAKTLGQSH